MGLDSPVTTAVTHTQARRLRGRAGDSSSKILGGGYGPASPKFQKYLTKYKFLVFPTAYTVSCVVFILYSSKFTISS